MLNRRAMLLRWTPAVLCLLAASAAVTGAIDCYCSNTEGCVNNTCSGNDCGVKFEEVEGEYRLKHSCFTIFISCFGPDPYACCKYPDCNRCLVPTFNLDGVPEGVNLYSLLPPECPNHVTTPVVPPTTPPTHSSSTNPDPVTSTSTDSTTTVSEVPPGGVMLNLPPWLYAIIFLGILVIFLCILCLIVVCWVSHRRRYRCEVESIGSLSISEMDSFPEEITVSNDSGGLKHCRFLEPRTIGQQVSFKERLAKGGFGEVWRGDLNGEPVAVKVMSSLLEECWQNEQDIYLTNMLHHESILRFIAVDNKIIDFSQKLIIIVEYHPHGSLFDYLSTHVISSQQLLRMMSSVINGISFLHMPVTSTFKEREKPPIAHRDIKTKNILVKRDGSCCIADFGLSLGSDTYKSKKKPLDPIKGTKRYMAPEILSRTINSSDFQSFVKVDIYAFGLVLWETTRRCGDVGEVGEYQVPYQNCVPNDPSMEDMKKIVVTEGLRPDLEERWKRSEVTSTMSSIMQECWRANPLSRLSAFRIKKKLQALSSDVKESLPSTPPPPLKPDTQF